MVGSSSAAQFGERCALSARDVRNVLDLGVALHHVPQIEPEVRDGSISVEGAGCVGEVYATPALQRPDDDWLAWARTETVKVLRARVQQRKEEARLGDERAHPLTVYVGQQARDDFAKARAIASRRAGQLLTPGQTFTVVIRHYVDTFDDDPGYSAAAPGAADDRSGRQGAYPGPSGTRSTRARRAVARFRSAATRSSSRWRTWFPTRWVEVATPTTSCCCAQGTTRTSTAAG